MQPLNPDFVRNSIWRCVSFGQQAVTQRSPLLVIKAAPYIFCYTLFMVEPQKKNLRYFFPSFPDELLAYPSDPHFIRAMRRKAKDTKTKGTIFEIYGVYRNTISTRDAVEMNKKLIHILIASSTTAK
jgi:hypothetical protein